MFISSAFIGLAVFVGIISARPSVEVAKIQAFEGIATFNDYAAQGSTVCGSKTANIPGYFGAAAGDISRDISGGPCTGEINTSLCRGQFPVSGYQGPACPQTKCGTCYKVTNIGGYGGSSVGLVGVGNVIVQIIDACPANNAFNFCKTAVPANKRCGDASTNSLDIDISAYQQLTGTAWSSGWANLKINIEPIAC